MFRLEVSEALLERKPLEQALRPCSESGQVYKALALVASGVVNDVTE